MSLKMAAKELKPGMLVLYRNQWWEVVKYDQHNKAIIIKKGNVDRTLILHPNVIVTVKSAS